MDFDPNRFDGMRLLKVTDEWKSMNTQLRRYNNVDFALISFLCDTSIPHSICPIIFRDLAICAPMKATFSLNDDDTSYDNITTSPSVIIVPNKPLMDQYVEGHTLAEFRSNTYGYTPSVLKTKLDIGTIGSMTKDVGKLNIHSSLGNPIVDSMFMFDLYDQMGPIAPLWAFEPIKQGWSKRATQIFSAMINKTPKFIIEGQDVVNLWDSLDKTIHHSGINIYPDVIKQKPVRIHGFSNHSEGVTSVCLKQFFKETIHYVFYAYLEDSHGS